jgi:hypothetical protein
MLISMIPLASIVAWAEDTSTAKHTIVWVSGTDATISGNQMDVSPKTNTETSVRAQVQFSCGGDYTAAPGEIEMRIPAHIMFKRDGTPADTVYVPLNPEGTAGGETQFWYRIDDNGTPEYAESDYVESEVDWKTDRSDAVWLSNLLIYVRVSEVSIPA